jgi:hypothetical protein
MTQESSHMHWHVQRLERQVRVLQALTAGILILLAATVSMPTPQAQQATGTMRVRQLVIEDLDGRPRMVLGYLDAPGNLRRFGIRLNDPKGAERFGLSHMESGAMVMGFDAPPGTGDDRNRERITIVTDEKGGARIRFLDRRTGEVSRMYLDEQNRAWLSFSDFTQKPTSVRRYGLTGEEVVRPESPQ